MANTNSLLGVKCPKCGQEDAFKIEAKIMVFVTDDYTEDQGGDYFWDESSPCHCTTCDFSGTLASFTTKQEA